MHEGHGRRRLPKHARNTSGCNDRQKCNGHSGGNASHRHEMKGLRKEGGGGRSTHTHTDTDTERERETETERARERERERHTHTQRHTHTHTLAHIFLPQQRKLKSLLRSRRTRVRHSRCTAQAFVALIEGLALSFVQSLLAASSNQLMDSLLGSSPRYLKRIKD